MPFSSKAQAKLAHSSRFYVWPACLAVSMIGKLAANGCHLSLLAGLLSTAAAHESAIGNLGQEAEDERGNTSRARRSCRVMIMETPALACSQLSSAQLSSRADTRAQLVKPIGRECRPANMTATKTMARVARWHTVCFRAASFQPNPCDSEGRAKVCCCCRDFGTCLQTKATRKLSAVCTCPVGFERRSQDVQNKLWK